MKHVIQRNAALIIGVVLAGFIGAWASTFLVSPRGSLGPTVFQAQSPVAAVLVVVLCVAVATVVAGVVGRLVNAVVGLFVLGAGLFALNGRLDSIQALAFASAGSSSSAVLALLALEALLWAALMFAAVAAVFKLAGPLSDIEPDEAGQSPHPLLSAAALQSAAAGAAVLVAVFLIGQSPMKGQMIGATIVGGMITGLVGRLISPHVQPVLVFVSPIVFGAVGYVIAMFMLKLPLDTAYVAGELPALSMAMPLDYAAGSLLGVAVGVGWARSFLHHDDLPAPAAARG